MIFGTPASGSPDFTAAQASFSRNSRACPAVLLNSLAKSAAPESRCSFSRCKSAAATRVDHRYCTTANKPNNAASAQQITSSARELNDRPIHLHSRPKPATLQWARNEKRSLTVVVLKEGVLQNRDRKGALAAV